MKYTYAIFDCGCPVFKGMRWCERHGLPYQGDPFRTEDADPVLLIEAEWRELEDVSERLSLVAFVVALCGNPLQYPASGWIWADVH